MIEKACYNGRGGKHSFYNRFGGGKYLGQKETIGVQKWVWNVHEMIIIRAGRNLRELQVQVLYFTDKEL